MKYHLSHSIIITCTIVVSILQYWFANNEDIFWDCKNPIIWWYAKYTSLYPEKLIEIAQQHLTAYCCTSKKEYLNTTTICENITSDSYVDSPRLYDHLIDLGMRYLDGDSDLQYSQAPLDTKGKERRNFVNEYGNNPTGWIPLELQNKYTQYRGTMVEDFDIIESWKSCEQRAKVFSEYNQNRNNISLAKKYFVICELSSCMVNGEKNNRISACQSLVTERITGERNYVQWLLLHQGTLALATNFEAYALWHINHDMFTALLEKIVMMSKWLGFVNNKVNEMTKMCSA